MRLYALILAITSLFGTILVFRYAWTSESKTRTVVINLSISFFIFFYSLLGAEFYFRFFFKQSDSFGVTLASKLWTAEYWKLNSLGYRDVEHPKTRPAGKKIAYIVGDSFVAGEGIESLDDRFASVLQRNLGEKWEVITIARCGWWPSLEYHGIITYPYGKPDTIVLSYYINDISGAANQSNSPLPARILFKPPPKAIRKLVYHSFLFNFLYWRVYRFVNSDIGKIYWDWLENSYKNEKIWQSHKEELLEIVDYSKKHNINLVVLVFPQLRKIEASKPLTSGVIKLMKEQNVQVIDLATELSLASRPPAELVVNSVDSHPSVKLNKEVGDMLVKYVIPKGKE